MGKKNRPTRITQGAKKATITVDCSEDEYRFVASNEEASGRADPKKKNTSGNFDSPITGKQIWRNKVYYCKSPFNRAKLGASVKYFIKLDDAELAKYLEQFNIDQLFTLMQRAKASATKAEEEKEMEQAVVYARLAKAAAESIKEYRKTLQKGKGKGKVVERPKKEKGSVGEAVKRAGSMEEGLEL